MQHVKRGQQQQQQQRIVLSRTAMSMARAPVVRSWGATGQVSELWRDALQRDNRLSGPVMRLLGVRTQVASILSFAAPVLQPSSISETSFPRTLETCRTKAICWSSVRAAAYTASSSFGSKRKNMIQRNCDRSAPLLTVAAGWSMQRNAKIMFLGPRTPFRKLATVGVVLLKATAPTEQKETQPLWYTGVIRRNRPEAEDLFLLECVVPQEIVTSYHVPGQYVMLRRDSMQAKPGFFSITSPPHHHPDAADCIELLVKQVDRTRWLCALTPGSSVEVTVAQGSGFALRSDTRDAIRHVLLFATGSGIAPIRAVLEDDRFLAHMDSVKVYYGCRNLHRMAYQKRFAQWQQERGVQVVPVLSQPDTSWTGERGYVQHALERDGVQTPPEQTLVFLCGLPGMTSAVEAYLLKQGLKKQQILYNF